LTIDVRLVGAEAVDRFEALWRVLDGEHRRVGPTWPQWWDRDRSWQIRRARYEGWLDEPGAFALLAERDDGEAVGYCVVHLLPGPDDSWRSGELIADFESLCVLAEHRDEGLGSRLFETAADEARRRGARDIWIGVVVGNEAAMRFYRRHGLRAVMTTMARFGDDDAAS
jgi:ribosomal protein S18 acetylase RimI-like enzyme